jgi:hypothetical protein
VVETVTAPLHRLPLIIVALAAISPAACGHVLDEYLQSTLVVIEQGDIRLKINLTPGIEIAEQVLSRIDMNSDGVISTEESAAYGEMLRQDITARLDGRDTQLKLTWSNIPELAELRTGHGIIQTEFSITPSSFSAGNHHLTVENRHFDSLGSYLFNAARPKSGSIRIVSQDRNKNQSRGDIEFAYSVPPGLLASLAVVVMGVLTVLWRLRRQVSANREDQRARTTS